MGRRQRAGPLEYSRKPWLRLWQVWVFVAAMLGGMTLYRVLFTAPATPLPAR